MSGHGTPCPDDYANGPGRPAGRLYGRQRRFPDRCTRSGSGRSGVEAERPLALFWGTINLTTGAWRCDIRAGDIRNETKGGMAGSFLLLPANLMAEDLLRIGLFNKDAAIVAAQDKGFLKNENIRVEINTVTDSPTLLRNLISGGY